jgi:diguanylate cyclase (GGDEF)-like protein
MPDKPFKTASMINNKSHLMTNLKFMTNASCGYSKWWFVGTRHCLKLFFFCLLCNFANTAQAEVLPLPAILGQHLGNLVTYLIEKNQPLKLEQVQTLAQEGKFQSSQKEILTFGINSKPVWIRLELENQTDNPMQLNLVACTTWVDSLQVHVVHKNQLVTILQTGDEQIDPTGLTPSIGYVLPITFLPGHTELYLRIDSIDPMVIPLELLTTDQVTARTYKMGYTYGLIYGFLIALAVYNFLLFIGLGERSYLFYSLTLISVILGNIAYTGYGLAWLWSGHLQFQRYIILIQMVVYSCFGLLFAYHFLAIAKHTPKIATYLKLFCAIGIAVITLSTFTDSHIIAAYFAFIYMSLFTFIMYCLGFYYAYQGNQTARYFLAASACGMLGAISTVFAVWGWLPFTYKTYHALEIGLILEASLFAFALAYQVRHYQRLSLQAEQLARIDPLTGLHNRRAFVDLSNPVWNATKRQNRSISIIMLDIDHFKLINDQYGHEAGDWVLVEMSRLLTQNGRGGDVLARWGGEEFVMLLPETNLSQASLFAERIRVSISAMTLPPKCGITRISASFGVAERIKHHDLEDLIRAADTQLYIAKHGGRNQVSSCVTQAI